MFHRPGVQMLHLLLPTATVLKRKPSMLHSMQWNSNNLIGPYWLGAVMFAMARREFGTLVS